MASVHVGAEYYQCYARVLLAVFDLGLCPVNTELLLFVCFVTILMFLCFILYPSQ